MNLLGILYFGWNWAGRYLPESALPKLFEEYIEPVEEDEEVQDGDPKDDKVDKDSDVGKKRGTFQTKKK